MGGEVLFSRGSGRLLGEHGAAALEFIIFFPLLLLVAFSMIQIGFTVHAQIVLTDAAREAARAASVAPGPTGGPSPNELSAAQQAARQVLQASGLSLTAPFGQSWMPYNDQCRGSSYSEWKNGICDFYVEKQASVAGLSRPFVVVYLTYREALMVRFPYQANIGGVWLRPYWELTAQVVFYDER